MSGGFSTTLFSVATGVTLTLRNVVLDETFSNDADGGAIANQGTLIIENSTIQNGRTNLAHSGGAIFSSGPVFIANSTLKGNHAGSAGAIFINSGNARAQVTNSTFQDNRALNDSVGRGGAIWVGTGANLTVVDSQFVSNTSKYIGGALFITQGGTATVTTQNALSRTAFVGNIVTGSVSLTGGSGGAISSNGVVNLNNVNFSHNRAELGSGGAVDSEFDSAFLCILNVLDSDFDDNVETGTAGGGAILLDGSVTRIARSQFSRNSGYQGGAISTLRGVRLDVSDSTFDSNRADQVGGAINDENTRVAITQTVFTRNSAGLGGAIHISGLSTLLSISISKLFSNTAAADGGAVVIDQSAAMLTLVSLSGNSALSDGGGIVLFSGSALTLTNSALISNTSGAAGGGIYLQGAAASLTNATLSGNTASLDGGGIFINGSVRVMLDLNNVTITRNLADSNNDASGDGGGIKAFTGTVTLRNSIIAGNLDSPNNGGGGIFNPDCSGSLVSQGYNLLGMSNGCSGFVNGVNGDKVGTAGSPLDPLLAPLADNGGATWTHALLPGSPAFNGGNPLPPGSGGFACAATDQRGVKRPLGPQCDMGAYEAGAVLSLPLIVR